MDRDLHRSHADRDTSHWWFVARAAIIERTLRRHVTDRPARVLDVGTGAGGLIPVLSAFGEVVGVEADATNAQLAQDRNPGADIRVGKLPAALEGLPPASLVTAFDAIEHIDDDVGVLRSLATVLDRDGQICITVPAVPWLWSAHDDENGHLRRYTARSLRTALEAAGYRIEHLSYFNTLLFPMVAAARLVERVLSRRSEGTDFDRSAGPLDAVLCWLFRLERHVVPRIRLPIGVSLIAVARRE